jgi:two-component sensor histidine kinase
VGDGAVIGQSPAPELGRRALAYNVAFWTLFGMLQASNWLLSPIADRFPYPGRLIASALSNAYLWALFTPGVFRLAARVNAESGARLRSAVVVLGIGLGVGALATAVSGSIHGLLLPRPAGSPPADLSGLLWGLSRWYFQGVVTFFVVFLVGLASDLSRRYRAREREAAQLQAEQARLTARAAQLQARSAELETQLAEARLEMLRTRLNPHFLFNTLNAVSALITEDPPASRDMIALLSELLRHALSETSEQEIPLSEELRLLRLYLEILEIRYQGQLRTVVTIDPDVHDALVPNLLLQPLVENGMKHGIDRAGGHGTIEVLGYRSGDDLVLTVRDSGPDNRGTAARTGEGGVGLRLTRERLAELYGDQQRLQLEPIAEGGMRARVVLPYHTRADVRVAEEVAQA